jgi:predicted Zn-dependent peptidase
MQSRSTVKTLCALAVLCVTGASNAAAPAKSPAKSSALAPLPVPDVPFTKYVLPNGLTLIVHEDHKAPIVAVNLWYHVGSKNEPAGRTGFAHLFEHLMFGATGGSQKGWFERLEGVGATGVNGTTNEDRTNFFETVPKSALDMALAMEAGRMGHLLDNFDEKLLNTQRGVVQNEKRQGENAPYAVADDIITKSIWPAGHPYSHTVIGEMTDLDAAKVEDVKDWFSKYYGPSNAVLVLAGDITPAEAKEKVQQYFGPIGGGAPVSRQKEWIAKRTGMQRAVAQDHVAQSRLYVEWNAPPSGTADAEMLDLLTGVLAAGKSSRLYQRLVYTDQIATSVAADVEDMEIGSVIDVELTAKAGVPIEKVEAAFNQELKRLLHDGATTEEIERSKTRILARSIRALERVGGFGGKSDLLARSETFYGDPAAWKSHLALLRAATPDQVIAAGRRWMSDGAFTLEVSPFPDYARASGDKTPQIPTPGAPIAARFPATQTATLSNGMKVILAQRHDAPLITFNLVLDEGRASDPQDLPGVAALEANSLLDGTLSMDALALDERLGALGMTLAARADVDFTQVSMSVFSARLDPSLALFADTLLHPAFRDADVARRKSLEIAAIRQIKNDPRSGALRLASYLTYGAFHPYGRLATESSIGKITPEDLERHHQQWVQPRNATLLIVGDTTLQAIIPKLETYFASWRESAAATKSGTHDVPAFAESPDDVYLVNKPGAQQSVIVASTLSPPQSSPDNIAIQALTTALGGAFTSRLNLNLREDKHWAYGAFAFDQTREGPSLFAALAPVQTDKTRESILEIRRELNDIGSSRPVTASELKLVQQNLTLRLTGLWETDQGVAASLAEIVADKLPLDYFDTYPARVDALTEADLKRAAGEVIKPSRFVLTVIGDQTKVAPQLEALKLKIKLIDADGMPIAAP